MYSIISFHQKAAEQDTRLELHREAIENLQKTIICKDLAYYSLLIKAQVRQQQKQKCMTVV